RQTVAVQQVEEVLAEAEARHEEARTATGGPWVRQAAARQALADCRRAEALLEATPEPPAELRERIASLKGQIGEAQRGIDLVLALMEWRNGLVDADARAALGHVLCQLGHFLAAATVLREAAEKFPPDSPKREAAQASACSATRMASLEERLPEIAAGDVTLSSPAAWAEVGEVCRRTKRYAAAAH